jgi:hypothetical protein
MHTLGLDKMLNKIKNLIKRSVTRSIQKDGTQFYNVKISNFGKDTISEVVHPYGTASSPPKNSRAITFQIIACEENLASLVYDPNTRFTGLQEGEYKAGNQLKSTYIYFKTDGSIEIQSSAGLTINGGDVTINGGNLSVPDGNVGDQGTLNTTTMQEMRAAYNAHTHLVPGVSPPNIQM